MSFAKVIFRGKKMVWVALAVLLLIGSCAYRGEMRPGEAGYGMNDSFDAGHQVGP